MEQLAQEEADETAETMAELQAQMTEKDQKLHQLGPVARSNRLLYATPTATHHALVDYYVANTTVPRLALIVCCNVRHHRPLIRQLQQQSADKDKTCQNFRLALTQVKLERDDLRARVAVALQSGEEQSGQWHSLSKWLLCAAPRASGCYVLAVMCGTAGQWHALY